MKREILCPDCRKDSRKLFQTDTPFPGEFVKFIDGSAIMNFKCDGCGCEIAVGKLCTAFSSWADYGGIPYSPWEYDYIDIGVKVQQ
jgi:hypothetical protein